MGWIIYIGVLVILGLIIAGIWGMYNHVSTMNAERRKVIAELRITERELNQNKRLLQGYDIRMQNVTSVTKSNLIENDQNEKRNYLVNI